MTLLQKAKSELAIYQRCSKATTEEMIAALEVKSELPDLGSSIVNAACWKFIDTLPHQVPGPIFNDLKPAIYAAIIHVLENQEKRS
jgi:hypothetical protein